MKFTKEDVTRLRDVSNYYEGIYDGDDSEYYRMYSWAEDLANRIEAVLPHDNCFWVRVQVANDGVGTIQRTGDDNRE